MSEVRQPAVAGQFYEESATALSEQVTRCFTHEHGPGTHPAKLTDRTESIHSAVAPHAGLPFSGPIAAHTYAALGAAGVPETVIIAGPNHRGGGAPISIAPHDAWETPLGTLPIDTTLRSATLDAVGPALANPHAHVGEHSIEVQLPFLQVLDSTPMILPIIMTRQDPAMSDALASGIASAVADIDRDVVFIASTDLTHYQTDTQAREADQLITDAITRLDHTAVIDQQQAGHSLCGPAPLAAALRYGATDGASGEVLAYGTSADTAGTPDRVVGYTAAIISAQSDGE